MNDKIEKKLGYILMGAGILAIIIIILVYFPWGGDKNKITKEYDFLTKENVYEYIEIDEVKTMINNGESFQLFICNKNVNLGNYFATYTDELAKEHNIETIYYFNTYHIKSEELLFLKENVTSELTTSEPVLVYFELNEEKGHSTPTKISLLEDYKGYYSSNYWLLLTDYFKNCYKA